MTSTTSPAPYADEVSARQHFAADIDRFGCEGSCGFDGTGADHIESIEIRSTEAVAFMRCGYAHHVDRPAAEEVPAAEIRTGQQFHTDDGIVTVLATSATTGPARVHLYDRSGRCHTFDPGTLLRVAP